VTFAFESREFEIQALAFTRLTLLLGWGEWKGIQKRLGKDLFEQACAL